MAYTSRLVIRYLIFGKNLFTQAYVQHRFCRPKIQPLCLSWGEMRNLKLLKNLHSSELQAPGSPQCLSVRTDTGSLLVASPYSITEYDPRNGQVSLRNIKKFGFFLLISNLPAFFSAGGLWGFVDGRWFPPRRWQWRGGRTAGSGRIWVCVCGHC